MIFLRSGAVSALLAALLSAPGALAQSASLDGRRISAVEFRGVQPLDPRDLSEAQPLKAGETFHTSDAGDAIDRLFATGRFADIQVEADPAPDGGVNIRFVTKPQLFVGHIAAEGKIKNPPNRGNILNSSGVALGQVFDDSVVPEAERRIRDLMQRNGLYEGTVSTDVLRDPEAQQMQITFHIKSGKRARYDAPIITGDTKLPEKTIIKATGWRRFLIGGYKQVTEQKTRNATRGILQQYQKHDRLEAKVELRDLHYDPARRRVKATIYAEGGPKVKITTVEAKVSKRKLRRYIPVYQELTVDRDLLVEGARNLRDYFQTQGYYDVDIDFRERPAGADETTIEYVISRGQRYKLVEVRMEGNKYFDVETLRERMFLEPAGFIRFRHGRYSEAMRKKDETNIENLYKANGFHDVKVTSEAIRDYKGKSGDIAAVFRIDEGQQWFVSGLNLEGVNKLNREQILGALSSLEGQPYSETNVAADRSSILTAYYSNGFPDATFVWSQQPGPEPNRVNLHYIVHEGKQQFVRDVLVSGIETTRMSLINKRLTIDEGEPLSPLAVTDTQKNLYDTGVLAKVTTAVQNPDGTTAYKHVLYDIEEADRYNINVGFGAEFAKLGGTAANNLSAPAGTTGFAPRVSLDVSRINLWGLGHFATIRGRVSTLEQQGSFSYTAPRFNNVEGRNVTFTALWWNQRDVRTFSSKREEASLQVSQQFSRATTGLFRYTWRHVSTSDVVIPSLLIPQLLQPVRIGMVSSNLAHDRRDNPVDATRGDFTTGDFGVASNYLGSSRSFVRLLARNATYHRLSKNYTLARQTTFGAILPFNAPPGLTNVEAIPLPERFFGGGSTSHRGFPENQAGPRDVGITANGQVVSPPTGFPLGGNATLINNIELRFPLIGENISGVLFHDMGNIYTDIGSINFRSRQRDLQDFNYAVHAVGFGIRYKTPVGPVRLDLSYSINPPSFIGFKGTIQDLLQCGAGGTGGAACTPVQQTTGHFQFFFSIGQAF